MTDKLKALLISKAEELDWKVYPEDDCWEFEKYSPAGEDFIVSIRGDGVVGELLDWLDSFDTEDHVMMHMEAKKNGVSGVPSLKELVEDADAIDKMVEDLYDALKEVEEQYLEEAEAEGDE